MKLDKPNKKRCTMAAAYKFIVCLSEIESPLFAKPNFSRLLHRLLGVDERLCQLLFKSKFQKEKLK